jgi:hypothetical protein
MAARIPQYATRAIADGTLTVNVALPNAGTTVVTNAIDLGTDSGAWPSTEEVTVQIATTAGNANSNNAATVNVVLQHSAVNLNANFVNIPDFAVIVINGVNSIYNATTVNRALPQNVLQFIRVQSDNGAAGGSANNGTVTLKLLF